MISEYKCICGKIFTTSNAFNGHKSHCKYHLIKKYGNLDEYYEKEKNRLYKSKIGLRNNFSKKKELKLENEDKKWKSETHYCEKCGKLIFSKFGSGRFCSRQCANSHIQTKSQNVQRSIKLKNKNLLNKKILIKKLINRLQYIINPSKCEICGNTLSWKYRSHKRCYKCRYIGTGGLRQHSGYSKHGTYKGIKCDSTYELVWVIYNIDHNINFKRCNLIYKYFYENKEYKYYPDFELDNGDIVEIKGFINGKTQAKLDSVKDRKLIVLMRDDLKYAFDYVKNNYNYILLEDLYDKIN